MTLIIPKYSRYSIDERLTIETAAVMQEPLKSLDSELERGDNSTFPRTSACTTQSSPASASSPHQSIFSAYWKTDPRFSRPLHSPSQSRSEAKTSKQPQRRRIHKTYSYTYDRDPYQFFGIEEDGSKTTTTFNDDDSDSLNSYELNLREHEVGVIEENCRRISTCPSLIDAGAGIDGIVLKSGGKTTQSDTILFAKTSSSPLKRLSCLRKSRFCFDADTSNNDGTQPRNEERKGKFPMSVSFESKIMVHLFQPPIEKWAASGWSNWFSRWY